MYRRQTRSAFVLTAAVAIAAVTAAPVAARAFAFHGLYSGSDPIVVCDLPVLNNYEGRYSGRAFVDRDGNQVKFDIKNSGTDAMTHALTGLTVTYAYEVLFKNFNSLPEDDGIFEGDQTMVGKSTYYGPNGEVLLTENGPITIHLTIDTNVDPVVFTAVVLSEHGHHPDVCPAVTAALLGA